MIDIARLIDHTLLRPDASEQDVNRICDEAHRYGFHSVCIHPPFIGLAKEVLFKSKVKVSSVIGFPMGMNVSQVKIYEAMEAALSGADELDIVINIGHARSDNWKSVQKEISDIITATPEAVHKIIIETCYLTDNQKKKASEAVLNAGAEFIKTSSGFGPSGAHTHDIELIKSVTRGRIGIKAAGGIKTLAKAMACVHSGAARIGTSSGVEIVKEEGVTR